MKEKALHFYAQGYNCSQCILKAAETVYSIPVSRQSMSICSGISTGFGVNGMCSVLIAGVMALGLLFDEGTVKRLRVKLLTRFHERFRSMDCGALKAQRQSGMHCEAIVGEVASLLETIIAEER